MMGMYKSSSLKVIRRSCLLVGLQVLAFCYSPNTHAQGNFPFPDSAALWVQTYSFMVVPPPFPQFEVQAVANIQVNGSDTTILGASYSRMTDAVTGVYYGAVRDEGGRVWYVPVDSVNAYLLFDFTVSPGDTVRDVIYYQAFPANWGGPYLVDAVVTSVQADPSWGGRLVVQTTFGEWIEGIGHRQGLLAESGINVSGYQLRLECMSHLDTVRFRFIGDPPFEEPGTCVPISVGISSGERSLATWRSYPNPSTGRFTIEFTEPVVGGSYYSVYDATGRVLFQRPFPTGATLEEVDLSHFGRGMYVLRVTDPEGLRHVPMHIGRVVVE